MALMDWRTVHGELHLYLKVARIGSCTDPNKKSLEKGGVDVGIFCFSDIPDFFHLAKYFAFLDPYL